ncbi:TylF/MycF/NovP-related O-methyltransferase [Stygiobacter electus]|uniref:Macrocin O-methyltransferase n=1 Tax=Stygiobacter electus TaxID=3032292 RepID=A0AAE3P295_9BACT|nr:TylF/MycF/NovP-related O-methyltransferase [Stygiobacter electus]MDF1613092.1 macrocin O-methyltransferase [Stygiobacter electus]
MFTWAQLSNIFEPTNYNRKIIGFDTFDGFPSTHKKDKNKDLDAQIGDLKGCEIDEFKLSLEKYNNERHLSHIKNIELVKGDFNLTGEDFLKDNPHLLISLLYLDFDIYEPTKKALEIFLPRMCKGAVICFDQLN